MTQNEQPQSYLTELRRGTLTLAVLGSLGKPCYGYALLTELQAKGIAMEANTLYPLLRRLESQGLLDSDWDTGESRPRKYYTLNATGRQTLQALLAEWHKLERSLKSICAEENDDVYFN